jgi:hypothetical protein
MTPSAIYRQFVRFGCRSLSTYEDEAVLLGTPINSLLMDDLEAFFELVFGWHPRRHAPPGYRPARP